MEKLFLFRIGGFIGAIARFGTIHLSRQYLSHTFPFSTLIINVVDRFAVGVLFEYGR